MTKSYRIFKAVPAYALCVCLALACTASDIEPQETGPEHKISFAIYDSREPGTKGIPVSSDNLATLYADNIRVAAFRGNQEYIPAQPLRAPLGGNTFWHTAESYFWPESGSLDFWAWAPSSLGVNFSSDHTSLSFGFSLPAPDADTKQDALGQRDIVLTQITTDRSSYNGGVPLTFSHPLASIIFRGGTMRDGIIRSISLKGVAGSGECTFNGSDFIWNVAGGPLNFTQTFDAPVSASQTGQPITMAGPTSGERTFLMIPQTLREDAALEVVFDDGTDVHTYTHSLAGGVWKAGTRHTYTISLSPFNPSGDSEGITVEESFDGYTKTHVAISNSSDCNLYLRAMIEANWVDAGGNIVAPCDISGEGSIQGFNVLSNGGRWTLYSDGFYYYKKAIRPGRQSLDLFTAYTPGPAPLPGCHLEVTVAAQAVEHDVNQKVAKGAWGFNIPLAGSIE